MEPDWITPSGVLRIEPSLPCILKHGFARRAVQEHLGNRMHHASKLARQPLRRTPPLCIANRRKRNPRTGDDSVFLR